MTTTPLSLVVHIDGYPMGTLHRIFAIDDRADHYRVPLLRRDNMLAVQSATYQDRIAPRQSDMLNLALVDIWHTDLRREWGIVIPVDRGDRSYYRGRAIQVSSFREAKAIPGFEVLDDLDVYLGDLITSGRSVVGTPTETPDSTSKVGRFIKMIHARNIDLSA